MDPDEAMARARLAAILFRAAMPRLAPMLPADPAARAACKERLFAALEKGAWSLPAAALDGSGDDSWETRVVGHPDVSKLLDAALKDAQPR